MSKFLESCRQCYALIGLIIVISSVSTVWAAGRITAKAAEWLGLLPFTWEDCPWYADGCFTETYSGPESFIGFMVWGVLSLMVACFAAHIVPRIFKLFEMIGRDTVKHISKVHGE